MDSVTNKSTDEAKKKPLSSKTGAFFWSVLFLIQENVCNCTQFESTLQLLQDFFAFRVKFSENKSVTTSKPVICLKIRQLFNRNFLNVVKKTALCIPKLDLKKSTLLEHKFYVSKTSQRFK